MQTHPDVLIIPPDPPQMLVKVDQVRHVIHEIYYKPVEGGERVYIFSDADFMKEAANSLLKVLEEPPEFATIFLLSDNPSALLPTIRSRCMHLRLAPLSSSEVEQYLARHRPEWTPRERALVARVCGGGLGRARGFDLAGYLAARQDALTMLAPALRAGDHSDLFRVTDTYRSGAEGKAKTEHLIRTLYSLLEDMLLLKSGTAELVRNQDIQAELARTKPFALPLFQQALPIQQGLGIPMTIAEKQNNLPDNRGKHCPQQKQEADSRQHYSADRGGAVRQHVNVQRGACERIRRGKSGGSAAVTENER